MNVEGPCHPGNRKEAILSCGHSDTPIGVLGLWWCGSGKNWHVAAKMRSRLLQDAFISTPFVLNHLMIVWLFLHKTRWRQGINRHQCGEKKMEKKREENGKWIMLVVPNWFRHGCYLENKVFFSPLGQAICAWPLTPPPAENHSHNLWILCIYQNPTLEGFTWESNILCDYILFMLNASMTQFCHPSFCACSPKPVSYSDCCTRQAESTCRNKT